MTVMVRHHFQITGMDINLPMYTGVEEPREWIDRRNQLLRDYNVVLEADFLLKNVGTCVSCDLDLQLDCVCGREKSDCGCYAAVWLLFMCPLGLNYMRQNLDSLLSHGSLVPLQSQAGFSYKLSFSYQGARIYRDKV